MISDAPSTLVSCGRFEYSAQAYRQALLRRSPDRRRRPPPGEGGSLTPEEKARRTIDRQLDQCGWLVQDRSEMFISAGPGVAVREYPMITGEADYLLYAGGKAIGIVEAKPQ